MVGPRQPRINLDFGAFSTGQILALQLEAAIISCAALGCFEVLGTIQEVQLRSLDLAL
jgi:hypothetical protein